MLTEAFENLLNRNLRDSPRARELCTALKGRRMIVIMDGTPLRVAVESLGTSLRFSTGPDGDAAAPEATVRGTPVNLLALAGSEPEAIIRRGDVTINGDAELVQRYRDLLKLLRPDVEHELARFTGDSVARSVSQVAASVLGFGERFATTAVRNTAEYFAHESRDLVPHAEAHQFLTGVDGLREQADRFEARLAALETRLQTPANASVTDVADDPR